MLPASSAAAACNFASTRCAVLAAARFAQLAAGLWQTVLWLNDVCAYLQKYEMLVTEHSIDSSRRTYCPFKDCSCLLERPDDEDEAAAGGQDFPFECPACHRCFCLSCGVTGWHTVIPCTSSALPSARCSGVYGSRLHGYRRGVLLWVSESYAWCIQYTSAHT
eukprot:GHRQ01025495.1.p1 GENE.GHRQ01025495.1~~GHRQ01025495.1.p1  ORF type:complete len:163 (+),score=13.17 GHRQ01025495.1:576-1064(+)